MSPVTNTNNVSNTNSASNIKPQGMRVIKVATCLSCTAKATLTYHVGCNTNNDIAFRVYGNTGGGLFSAEWIALSAIQTAFDTAIKPITSFTLDKLFIGRSTNTPGFLMAVLKSEGLVKSLEGKVRGYEVLDPSTFMTKTNTLIASGLNLTIDSQKRLATIKPATTIKAKNQPATIVADIAFASAANVDTSMVSAV